MDVLSHNREAWDRQAREGCRWSSPVGPEAIEAAKRGVWEVYLTPNRPVPREWFGDLQGKRILCLASGGGQQAPILAAAGAHVTSFDLSDEQLARDRLLAEREGLPLECIQGDMADLSAFGDSRFDLVFNPISTVFVPDVRPVWRECSRVLGPGGSLLAGFMNPGFFLFEHESHDGSDPLSVRYGLPYSESEFENLSPARRKAVEGGEPMEFSHSLDALIGGQLVSGFVIVDFFEDWWSDDETPLNSFSPTSMATRATLPPLEIG